jgi:NAD dependent epimerase/dehydratase
MKELASLKGKQILVTGAAGFIGSHLVEGAIATGAKVRALVRYNSSNSWGWLDRVPKETLSKVQVVAGDIRDSHFTQEITAGVDTIFHLAALIAIPYSYAAPESYVDTNVYGTLNVLQAARTHKCRRTLITSTSEVYGTAITVPISEEHPRQGQSPYAATKIAADAIADSFYRSFDTAVVTVRPFNTYGPRQSARAVIPTIITQLLAGAEEIRLGSVEPTRDLVFVEDTVAGFLKLAIASGVEGQDINIATQTETSIKDIALKLIAQINPKAKLIVDETRLRPLKSEVFRLNGSNQKLKKLTGWTPSTTVDVGLAKTIEWFKSNHQSYKSDIYNV